MKRREFLNKAAKASILLSLLGSRSFAANPTQNIFMKGAPENITQTHKSSVKTLLISSHPYPERSFFIKNLESAARSVNGVLVRNLESLYGFDTRSIDGTAERAITREFERIDFLFPTHWFNITPMMKAYLNETWGSVGPGLWQGKQMLIITTAGGGASTYGANGRVGVALKDIFVSMKASALHCGMNYLKPLAFEGVSSSELKNYQNALISRLTS